MAPDQTDTPTDIDTDAAILSEIHALEAIDPAAGKAVRALIHELATRRSAEVVMIEEDKEMKQWVDVGRQLRAIDADAFGDLLQATERMVKQICWYAKAAGMIPTAPSEAAVVADLMAEVQS